VRALKMVLLPTLGKPTIPQFRGTGTFLFYPLKHGEGKRTCASGLRRGQWDCSGRRPGAPPSAERVLQGNVTEERPHRLSAVSCHELQDRKHLDHGG
jgi:hypothetical protein